MSVRAARPALLAAGLSLAASAVATAAAIPPVTVQTETADGTTYELSASPADAVSRNSGRRAISFDAVQTINREDPASPGSFETSSGSVLLSADAADGKRPLVVRNGRFCGGLGFIAGSVRRGTARLTLTFADGSRTALLRRKVHSSWKYDGRVVLHLVQPSLVGAVLRSYDARNRRIARVALDAGRERACTSAG